MKVGDSSVSSENRGYYYDTAWNLNRRTNNGAVTTFTIDSRNQLTSGYNYDANGNLITGTGTYGYDDENRLLSFTNGNYRSDFAYDGLGRMRTDTEYTWSGSAWVSNSTTELIYDGNRVIQERDGNNNPGNSYTRGTDLSGTMEGAGGIGGLLAFNRATQSYFYHADGNGNISSFENSSQTLSATYRYDPFGNRISATGIASVNPFQFSSQRLTSAGYSYLYRFYDPGTQRWLNWDPNNEFGFNYSARLKTGLERRVPNLYLFIANSALNKIDPDGLKIYVCTEQSGWPTLGFGTHAYLWDDRPFTLPENRGCDQESAYGRHWFGRGHMTGPVMDSGAVSAGTVCVPVDGSDFKEDGVMACCERWRDEGPWIPNKSDCHTKVDDCLNSNGLTPPPHPRWGPQDRDRLWQLMKPIGL